MGKLEQVNDYVAMTLDKLPAIRGDLVRTDPVFENWTFDKLAEAISIIFYLYLILFYNLLLQI